MRLLGLVTLAIMAASTAARAKPTIITIRGDACDLSALEAELTDTLAAKSIGDSRVSVVTRTSDQALSAEVLFVDANGKAHGPRVVMASSCDDLIESIGLVIVMAIPAPVAPVVHEAAAPGVEQSEMATTPLEPSIVPAVDAPRARPADDLSIARSTRAEARTELSIDGYIGGASTVTGRGVNEQLLLGARLKYGRASFSLQARVDAPEEVRITSSGKVTVTQADLSVTPCVHLSSLAGCALLSVGFLHGSGESLDAARNAFTPVLATGLRLGWEHFVSHRLALRFHVDGRALLTTTTFDVDYMPVWESGRFEASVGVGLLARFL